jgi:hypothetical protein
MKGLNEDLMMDTKNDIFKVFILKKIIHYMIPTAIKGKHTAQP